MPKRKTALPSSKKKNKLNKPKKVPRKKKEISTEPSLNSFVGSKGLYLSNKELLAELKICRTNEIMSDKLARMLQLLCSRYAKRGNFAGYTYNDDMQSYAMLMLVRTWKSFNPRKSNNPFAFFTQCIKNSFIQYLNQEKRQRDIRDGLLLDMGKNPSFNYLNENSDEELNNTQQVQVEDEEDHEKFEHDLNYLKKQIENLPEEDLPPNNEEQIQLEKNENNLENK